MAYLCYLYLPQATTVAFMTAKIEERGEIAAKLAAAAAYTPFILTVIHSYVEVELRTNVINLKTKYDKVENKM